MAHRTTPPRPPAVPPATAEDGAARVHALLVKLFDGHDGKGANWRLMLESLYRAGFRIADDQLDDDARQKIMRRVYEGAEVRLTGGYADGSGPNQSMTAEADVQPSNAGLFKSMSPKPPR